MVEIQPNAFWKCEKLTTVTLPDSLQTLGYGVFMECASLTEIEIPHGISKIEQDMFQGCTSLVRVGISDSVTEIGAYAFYGCQSLAEIKLPDKIECINNNTFYDCDSLTEITIPEGVTKIGASAFYDADGLQAVRLPESLQEMDPYAFALCDSLASIRIPQSVTYIGDCAFKNCFALLDMTVDPQNTVYKSEDNCLIEISKERLMFASVQSSIPQGVKIIGESVFDHSTITRITIPESVTQIEYMAFAYSYNLYFLVLPAGLTSIDRYAFYCCTSVNNVYYTGTEEQWQDIAIYVTGNDNILEAIMHYEHVVQ